MLTMMSRGIVGAVEALYPNIPEQPLPSPCKTGNLVGTYTDLGYGSFTLRQELHPDKHNGTLLVAGRSEMTWKYKLEMHHVLGDHWVVYIKHLEIPNPKLVEFSSMEVKVGHDGRCLALDIYWMNRLGAPVNAGISSFRRIS